MAIRTVAQAAADIRLSDAKANQDFERIRRQLVARAQRLEADLALAIPVTLDQDTLLEAAAAVSEVDDLVPPLTVPVELDDDQALTDYLALSSLLAETPIAVPVSIGVANREEAVREISSLGSTEITVQVPVRVDDQAAVTKLGQLRETDIIVDVVPRADVDQALQDLNRLDAAIDDEALIRVRATGVTEARAQIEPLGDGVDIPLEADPADVLGTIASLGDVVQPVTVPLTADPAPVLETVRAIEPEPVPVRFTTPGISPTALSRIRADLANIDADPVIITAIADVDEAVGAFNNIDPEPVVIPAVADTADAAAQINALGGGPGGGGPNGPDPIVIPVDVDGEAAVAEARQTGAQISRAVEPEARRGGQVAGLAFGRQFAQTANRVLATAALTVGGLLATSLVEGFSRFTTIQDSTESLTVALQDASEAGQVLSDVLNVVRGTPFRLDDFARAATNMISFGIAAEQVPRFLTAIGEAAATRGSQAAQFAQSLAVIFGQVQAIGRINGEDVWQFGNVGVDVLRILGNTLDKTTEQIRKMISEGAIPANFALEAIASGILNGTTGINGATVAFSGVMERLGDTLSGSIENFGAARARFGVAIIDPLSDTLVTGFQSLTKVVDDFTVRTRGAFDRLVETPFIEGVNTFFENLPNLIDPAVAALDRLGPALAPLTIGLSALGLGALGSVLGPLGALIPGVTSLAGAFGVAATAAAVLTPEIRDELLPVLVEFGEVGANVGGSFVRGLSAALEEVTPTVIRAIGVARNLLPEFQTFLGAAFAAVGDVGEAALPVLDQLVTFAEEALPVAFRLATDGVVLLSEAAVAAAPVVEQLIAAGTDLVPVFEGIAGAAETVGEVLIPVLDTLGDVIGDIPVGVLQALLGAFLGFKAVSFFQNQVRGINSSLTSLRGQLTQTSVMFNQFRIQGENSVQALGKSVLTLRGTSAVAATSGSAIAGAFSGMALASEDAASRITGALGAIGTVALGFAQGGIIGGALAGAAVGIGFIVGEFTEGKRRTEEFEQAVVQLADRIRSEFDDELVSFEGVLNSRIFTDLVTEALDPTAFDELVNQLGIRMEDLVEVATVTSQDVNEAIRNNLDPEEVAAARFDSFLGNISFELAKLRAQAEGLDLEEILGIQDIPLMERTIEQTNLLTRSQQRVDEIMAKSREDVFKLNEVLATTTGAYQRVRTEATFTGDAVGGLGDAMSAAADETDGAGEAAAKALADWKKATADTTLSAEELRAMYEEAGEDAVTAAELAQAAWEDFGDTLDAIRGKLDLTTATQNLSADLRGIGEALDEVVNVEDLNKVEQINEQISRVRDRIADLQVRLAEETADANEEAGLLEQRIAKAEAIGAVNAAAELRRQLGEVFDGATDIQRDIDDEFARIDELRGELAGLTTEPITRMQQLTQQAAEANLSFFEFLLAAPTPEAREFFQNELAGTVEGGIARVEAIAEEQGAIAGSRALDEFLGIFRGGLTDAGIDPATIELLIANLLPPDLLALNAQTAAQATVTAFFDEIEAINAAPEGEINIPARIVDLEAQAAEIESFLAEHPEITLPVGISTEDFDAEIEALRTRASQISIEDERARFAERNPQALNEFIRATQTDAEKAAQDSAQKILDEINSLDPDTMDVPARLVGIDQEITDLQETLNETGVELPITLTIDRLNVAVQAAEFQAQIQERLNELREQATSFLPSIFRNAFHAGGITGYRIEDHRPQIAHGYRLWAEPETGGEAYIPLAMGKRTTALDVFMKVADIFDFDVHPREPQIVTPVVHVPPPLVRFDALRPTVMSMLDLDHSIERMASNLIVRTGERDSIVDRQSSSVFDRASVLRATADVLDRTMTVLDRAATTIVLDHTIVERVARTAVERSLVERVTERATFDVDHASIIGVFEYASTILDRASSEVLDQATVSRLYNEVAETATILDRAATILDRTAASTILDHTTLSDRATTTAVLDRATMVLDRATRASVFDRTSLFDRATTRVLERAVVDRASEILDRITTGTIERTLDRSVFERSSAEIDRATTTVFERAAAEAHGVLPTIPDIRVPDVVVNVEVPPPPPVTRQPVTQRDFDGALHIGKIEKLVIEDAAPGRRASQIIRKLKAKALGI